MSRPSEKRKKGVMKATTRQATLDTIREDEAATPSSTLQDPTAIGSNAFRKTSKGRRRRQAKVSCNLEISVDAYLILAMSSGGCSVVAFQINVMLKGHNLV